MAVDDMDAMTTPPEGAGMPERVKRYDLEDTGRAYMSRYEMVRDDDYGDWVSYEDYAALESRLRAAEDEIENERRGASEIARLAEAQIATLTAERDALAYQCFLASGARIPKPLWAAFERACEAVAAHNRQQGGEG